jgi:hypothetical protein
MTPRGWAVTAVLVTAALTACKKQCDSRITPPEEIKTPAAAKVADIAQTRCGIHDGVDECIDKVKAEFLRRNCRCGVETDYPMPTRCRPCRK